MKLLLTTLSLLIPGFGAAQSLPVGQVIDTVRTGIAGQTYALYLPVSYTPEKEYPVIFFFEPLARGTLPVDKYKPLADKYGLILTCTNNSRNYTSPFLSFDAADAVIDDVLEKFSVDEDMLITSGFSGGSRTAVAAATLSDLVRGVIGIGAVDPIYNEHRLEKHHKIFYAGLVGNRDFNYVEHYRGEQRLLADRITNIRLVFNGPHQWAPVEDYEIALIWMLARLQPDLKDRILKKAYLEAYLKKVGDSLSAIDVARTRSYFSDFDVELSKQGTDADPGKEQKRLLKVIEAEEKLRKQYKDSLSVAYRLPANKNLNSAMNWIAGTGQSYKRRVKQNERRNPMRAEMYARLTAFVSAASYENSVDAMVKKDFLRAWINIEIWSAMIDNDRWEYWMKCKLHAMNNNIPAATRYLEKLIKSGFENGKALKADSTFNVLKRTDQYKKLTFGIDQ